MSTAADKPNLLAQAVAATDTITPPHRAADGHEEDRPPGHDRSADLEFQLEIRTIASRILAAALIDGAWETETVAS